MSTAIINALSEALDRVHSLTELARRLGPTVKRQNVEYWLRTGSLPERYGAALEEACGRVYRRWDMWPNDWHLIWPELAELPDAPQPQQSRDAA